MYMQEILNIMILNNFDYDIHIYLMKSLDYNGRKKSIIF